MIERMRTWEARVAVCRIGAEQQREHSDEALVFLLRNAVDQATFDDLFQELFRRYHLRVTGWCGRIARDPERAFDLAQEVFLQAFRRLDSFRGDSRFSTWLYAIARNHCLNALKKWRTEPVEKGEVMPLDLHGCHGMETHLAMERRESFENMWRLIDASLTPKEARVMALHYGHGLPLATITRELKLSNPSGAKAFIVNARRKLNAVLRGEEPKHSSSRISQRAAVAGRRA
jgi:RNA polymerase sigma-70 factor, ECF subfamily